MDKLPVLEYSFLGYDLLRKVQNLRLLPVLAEKVIGYSWIDKEERKYPLYLGSPYSVKSKVSIQLPPSLQVKYLPKNVSIKSDWMDLFIVYEQSADKVSFVQKVVVDKETVEEESYPEFKKVVEDILYNLNQQIILEKQEDNSTS